MSQQNNNYTGPVLSTEPSYELITILISINIVMTKRIEFQTVFLSYNSILCLRLKSSNPEAHIRFLLVSQVRNLMRSIIYAIVFVPASISPCTLGRVQTYFTVKIFQECLEWFHVGSSLWQHRLLGLCS